MPRARGAGDLLPVGVGAGSGAGATGQRVGEGGSGAAHGGLSCLRGGLVSQGFAVGCDPCAVSRAEGDSGVPRGLGAALGPRLNLSSGAPKSFQRGRCPVRPDPGQVFLVLSPLRCRQERAATCLTCCCCSKPPPASPARLGRAGGRRAWPAQAGHMPRTGIRGKASVRTLHPPRAPAASSHGGVPVRARCVHGTLPVHPPGAQPAPSPEPLHSPARELGQRWELAGLQTPHGGGGNRVPHPSHGRRALLLHPRVLSCHFGKAGKSRVGFLGRSGRMQGCGCAGRCHAHRGVMGDTGVQGRGGHRVGCWGAASGLSSARKPPVCGFGWPTGEPPWSPKLGTWLLPPAMVGACELQQIIQPPPPSKLAGSPAPGSPLPAQHGPGQAAPQNRVVG